MGKEQRVRNKTSFWELLGMDGIGARKGEIVGGVFYKQHL